MVGARGGTTTRLFVRIESPALDRSEPSSSPRRIQGLVAGDADIREQVVVELGEILQLPTPTEVLAEASNCHPQGQARRLD
jgi:hypothetical protein